MSNESLSAWKTDTSLIVVSKLPYQTLESALALVEDYLSATGGWIPDDVDVPTGPGVPASGATQTEAATTITEEQLETMYTSDLTATITLNLSLVSKLSAGLSSDDVLASIEDALTSWIESQVESTDMNFISLDSYSGTVVSGGRTTTSERVSIKNAVDDSINNGTTLYDPKEIALKVTREQYNLDNTFNVTYIFTETDNDLIFLIEKYLTNMTDLNLSDDNTYTVSLDAATYTLTSGIVKKREPIGV